jgi:DNA-binding transcriptional MerR regulator
MSETERTIDELAQHVGLPSSTIRLYQTRGLLPAPRKEGRVGYYGAGHVARIELIGRLQDRGFSLAAIGELVAGWEDGRSLDEVLGLEQRVPGIVRGHPPMRLAPAELADRFPGIEITPETLRRVVEMGLVELADDGTLLIASPTFLEVGSALVGLGFPLDDVLDEAAALESVTDDVAERFAAMFDRHVWQPFAEDGMPADRMAEVGEVLDRLAVMAEQVVQASLERSLARVATRFVAREATQPPPQNRR